MKTKFGSMSFAVCAFAVCAFAVCALAGRAFAAPVGMACGGKGELRSGAAWRPLKMLQRLESGDVVRGAGNGAIIVLFGNGQRFKVAAGKQATVGPSSIAGATSLGGANGPSARAAKSLGGARVGAVMGRPPESHKRLSPQSPGFIVAGADGSWRLPFLGVEGATGYAFSLLDNQDNVVWHARLLGSATEIVVGTQAALRPRRPYIWQMTTFGKSGKPPEGTPRWGVITFLDANDAAALTQNAAPLLEELRLKPGDETPRALLAELYRSYGVYSRTLEQLEELGDLDLQREAYSQISPFAFGRWLLLEAKATSTETEEPIE